MDKGHYRQYRFEIEGLLAQMCLVTDTIHREDLDQTVNGIGADIRRLVRKGTVVTVHCYGWSATLKAWTLLEVWQVEGGV